MIVEQRTYTLKPGATPEYPRLYEHEGGAIQEPVLGRLVGGYTGDFGPPNQIIHMWGDDSSYAERERRRAALGADPGWRAFERQENETLIPAPWSPS